MHIVLCSIVKKTVQIQMMGFWNWIPNK